MDVLLPPDVLMQKQDVGRASRRFMHWAAAIGQPVRFMEEEKYMTLLSVHQIQKTFQSHGGHLAVDKVSFSVEEGACFGLVGESGCGKSTTAAIISSFLAPDSGTVTFLGRSQSKRLKPWGCEMQMIFQNSQSSFDPRDTVMQAVTQGARAYHLYGKNELKERAMDLFSYVGLKESYAQRKVRSLSGGECQRAAIARALMVEPKLLICDEATSALDVLVQAQLMELLMRLKQEKKMAMVFITHDIPLAGAICDELAVMHQGRIVERGKTRDVLDHPKTEPAKALLSAVLTLA